MSGPSGSISETLENFSDLSSFTYSQSGDAAAVEVEDSDYIINGTKSIHMSVGAGSGPTAKLTKDIAHSFKQDDRLGLLMYVPARASGITMGLTVYGSDQVSLGAGGTGRWTIVPGLSSNGMGTERYGWNFYPISFANTGVTSGAPTIALDYLSMRFSILANAGAAREFYLDSLIRYRSRPTVVITFDDGFDDAYTQAHDYAVAAGIPLTHYLIADNIGATNYITKAQAQAMQSAGDQLAAHGAVSGSWEDDVTTIATDVDALNQLFGDRFTHGAYPGGGYGDAAGNHLAVQAACADAGLVSCRTVASALLAPICHSPYVLPATVNLQTGTSLQDAKDEVDRAVKHGLTCVIVGHKLESSAAASTWAIADWQALIDYIALHKKMGLLDTKTVAQWWAGEIRPTVSRG